MQRFQNSFKTTFLPKLVRPLSLSIIGLVLPTLGLEHCAGAQQATVESLRAVAPARRFVSSPLGYAITPPAGFKLQQTGRRTLWQGPHGAQLLVETAASASGSPLGNWQRLSATLARKYGPRYRLLRLRQAVLSGRSVAVWEFEIGETRKVDVGMIARGRGYAILVAAPRSRFRAMQPQFEAALRSFALTPAPRTNIKPPVKRPPARKPSGSGSPQSPATSKLGY